MDIAKIIQVLAENCPNETVAAFILTYGVFIVALLLIILTIAKTFKKISLNKDSADAELKSMQESIDIIAKDAASVAINQSKATEDIKNEIKANNDATMQLLISFGLALGVSYTDIQNTIEKSKKIYNVSTEQYKALENQVREKMEEEAKANAEAEEAKIKYVDSLINIQI